MTLKWDFFFKSRFGAQPRLRKPKNYNFWRIITHLQDTVLPGFCPTQKNLPKPSIVHQSPPWIQHTNAKFGDYFSRKRLKSADFWSKIPTFYQKKSADFRFRKCNLFKRRYPKWRQTRLTKKEKKYIQEEIILCVLCNPLEFECDDAVVKNQKKRPKTCHTFIIGDK